MASSVIGLFGKIPAQGDFIRVNLVDPAAQALDVWCQEGLDAVQRGGTKLLEEPVYFVFRTAPGRNILVGSMIPSQDKVGRNFPLVLYAVVESAATALRYSAVPVAYSKFLEAGAELLLQAATLSAADLTARLELLPLPTAEDFRVAEEICQRTLVSTSGREMQERLFGDLAAGRQHYAFSTVHTACSQFRGAEPPRTSITLDCPLAVDVDLFAWLELSRRLLSWRHAPPPFFWTEGEAPRLLLSLGPAPPSMLLFLAKRDHVGQRLWPLYSDRREGILAAQQTLIARFRHRIDDPSCTLESLITALAS